ncbi:PAS domain S-box protein, partial [bacterium]|nr:PAS domain S-box protein [bacterium]
MRDKTKEQLKEELEHIRRRVSELETAKSKWAQAERQIEHLNLVLRAIRNVNQLITKEKDRDRLIKRSCENLIETRGYSSAWIVLLDEKRQFIASAQKGLKGNFKPLEELFRRGGMIECGRRALEKSGVVTILDPTSKCGDCPLIGKGPENREMTIRLEHNGTIYGLMSVSIAESLALDQEEQSLFREVAGDISFALHDMKSEADRKLAELALQESEEKYRSLFSEMAEGVYLHEIIYDEKGKAIDYRIIDANPASEKILNIKPEDAIGKLATELYGAEEAPFLEIYANLAKTGIPFDFEKYFPPMKKHFHILAYCPQKGKFATVFSDITEQKRAEEALHESEEKFRTIASAAQDAVVVIDNEGKISYWNKAAEKMLGYTEGEVIGKNFHNLIVPKRFRATHFSAFPKFQKTGKGNAIGKTLKLAALTKNRDEIPVELSLSTTKFKGKWCAIGIMRDITERKRAEEELKASKEKLKEKNKELERIVYVASHDMRTPLVTIAGFSNELEISTKKIISILKSKKMSKKDRNKELSYIIEEDIPSSIRFIISGINKIQMMLDALLAYSRSGRSELEFEEVNMKETIEEIVASAKFDIEKTGAEIEIGKLPHCLADRIKVNQIFSNLIENAIKFF